MSKAIDFREIRDRISGAIGVMRGKQGAKFDFADIVEPWWKDFGIPLTAEPQKNMKMITDHLWAFVGASKIARTIAGLDIVFYEEGSKDEREPIKDHPFRDLLYRPNSFMTHAEFFELIVYGLIGAGSSYVLMDNPELNGLSMAGPTRMFPLLPQNTTPIPGTDDFISGFKYRSVLGYQTTYPAIQVLWFKLTNPLDYYKGLSPITPAKKTLDSDKYARERSHRWLRDGSAPGMILTSEEDVSPEDAKRMRDEWKRLHRGAKQAAEIAILFGGMKLDHKPATLKEMEYTKYMEFTREEILGALSIPPASAGIYRYANYANAKVQDKIFWTETIIPYKRVIEIKFNEHCFPRFGEDKLYMEFDVSEIEVLQEDKLNAANVHKTYVTSGIMTANEARADLGLDPIKGGDELVRPGAGGGAPAALTARPRISRAKGRDDRWNIVRNRMAPLQRRLQTGIKEYFEDLEDRVKSRLLKVSEPEDIDGIFPRDIEKANLAKMFKPDLKDIMQYAGDRAVKDVLERKRGLIPGRIKQGPGFTGAFDITDPEVLRWIELEAFKLSKFITETSYNDFRRILIQGIDTGAPVKEIAGKFDELFNWYRDYRSVRIARTELNTAYNRGSLFGYEDAEIERKQWLSARDDRVRGNDPMDDYDHLSFDGQTQALDAPFMISGEPLMHPGDPVGSPGNVINCRCVVDPVIPEIEEV